jgi:ubiquinone/menaquinone biosynthesis C-methylase UbiE
VSPLATSDQIAVIRQFGLGDEDLAAWQASELPPAEFVDWLTDRVARRPTGDRARRVYGAPDVHDFARRAILEALALKPTDVLLEIGSGGGRLLQAAAATGARVIGLDHSPDMARLSRQQVPSAGAVIAAAERLPFAADVFTAIAMSIVFFFFADPVGVLSECRRVLRRDGRVAVYTTAPELRGTPAAPEPLASKGHFYSDAELAALAEAAGLRGVSVTSAGGGQLLSCRA